MQILRKVLITKIVLTAFAWCIPLLTFPARIFVRIGFPAPQPEVFLRLLGVSYGALIVAYSFGLYESIRGNYPKGIIWTGIISNGGASVILWFLTQIGARYRAR